MATTLHIKNGKTVDGTLNEQIAMKLLWLVSFFFIALKYRGFWRICRPVLKVLAVKERQWLVLKSGLIFSVDVGDSYWNRLISPQFEYEPELHYILNRLKGEDFTFIDCGANMGYWSCFAASQKYGQKPTIAVEPLEENFELVKLHAQANGLKINQNHKAIWGRVGETLPLYKPAGHASVSLLSRSKSAASPQEIVTTTSLDELIKDIPNNRQNFLLKLDVEGVEIEALQGGVEFLKTNPVIFYEDHAEDASSKVTDYMLNELGYIVHLVTESKKLVPIKTAQEATDLKVNLIRGYNFIAFSPNCDLAKKIK